VPVALDVAVLATDREQHELVGVARVRDATGRRRRYVHETAFPNLARLAADLEARPAAVDEIQLVLRVVVVEESLVSGRVDDPVDAERGNA
jgi:hypothetical protein